MSGRDLKKFVNYHRTAIGASDNTLVTRLADGHASKQYKPIDYSKLQALTQVKRAAGDRALQKIEKISEARKISKEQNLMQQHKSCWFKEQIRLNSMMKKLQTEIDGLRPGSPLNHTSLKEFFHDLEIYEGILDEEMNEFKKCTVDPIWDLREDLQFWLGENRERLLMGDVHKEHSDVLEVVSSVKSQQKSVIDKLKLEQNHLEEELEGFSSHQMIVIPSLAEVNTFKTGIPLEAQELDCPDEALKESVLEEFNLLDRKYEAHLEYLNVKYDDVVCCPYGNWSKQDHFHFACLMEQYPAEMPNRRTLYIDRMLRELPHKGRNQLVEHENWCLLHKSYQNQRHSVLQAWSRDRKDLLAKIEAIFSDAWDAHEEHLQKKLVKQQQEKICHELYAKVLAFREQKLEALQLQAAITARQAEKEKEQLKAAQLKEKHRREKIKEKVKVFEEQKVKEREEAATREKLRLEELEARMAEQALLDRERVEFRKEKQKEKEELKKQTAVEVLQAEQEKERRLAKLREQVEVHVDIDPERVFKPTQATQARFASAYDEELELQQPLFTVHGYKDKKVASDPRLRVEQALRDAGLHQTEYARKVMATIQPPQQPRKDQHSTIFKYD
ncbi:coiled-coil domain-containing protein 148 [Exaiptasia diaphana]|uniref:Coiled-coil domain-containing protein 148 n=1 Tax=Exaiptasia diaphana TaxID=2652724 RepID=A0A913X5B5_EXADI|nr:coiled-coil domain-containing protein 148 [Exaiptasia diaphana]KXJ15267.1 Coiled-coil domain-containing protein 148 [Exaiptasia diaphana]